MKYQIPKNLIIFYTKTYREINFQYYGLERAVGSE